MARDFFVFRTDRSTSGKIKSGKLKSAVKNDPPPPPRPRAPATAQTPDKKFLK